MFRKGVNMQDTKKQNAQDSVMTNFLQDTKQGRYAYVIPEIIEIPRCNYSRDEYTCNNGEHMFYGMSN